MRDNTNLVTEKVSTKNKIAIALIPLGVQSLKTIINNFGTMYFTDVMGADLFMIGILMLILKISDGITDPILAIIMDNSRFDEKRGKYRKFYIIGAFCGMASALLMFMPQSAEFSMFGKGLLIFVSFLIFEVTSTLVPFNPIVTNLTIDQKERRTCIAIGRFSEIIVNVIFALFGIKLIMYFGNGSDSDPMGWFIAVSLSTVILCLLTIFGTTLLTEKDNPSAKHSQKISFKDYIAMFKDKAVAVFTLIIFFTEIAGIFLGLGGIYYVKYVYGFSKVMHFSVARIVGNVLGVFLANILSRKFNHIFAKEVSTLLAMFSMAAIFVMAIMNINIFYLFLALVLICSTASGVSLVTQKTIGMEILDYYEYKGGTRMQASISSVITLTQKVEQGIATLVLMLVLGVSGYVANENLTHEVYNSLVIISFLIPVIMCIFGMLVVMKYPITKKVRQEMYAALELSKFNSTNDELALESDFIESFDEVSEAVEDINEALHSSSSTVDQDETHED